LPRSNGPFIANSLQDSQYSVQRIALKALEELGWQPSNDKNSAIYWQLKHDFKQCAACGVYAIEPLLEWILQENADYDAIDAYATLGPEGLGVLIQCTDMLYSQYCSLTSGVASLNFSSRSDRTLAANIEYCSTKLRHAIWTIGKFGTDEAESYLELLYRKVKDNIYSGSERGWVDMFGAIKVRDEIISSFSNLDGERATQFLKNVMITDPSIFGKVTEVMERRKKKYQI
jgi:hypothetical protein